MSVNGIAISRRHVSAAANANLFGVRPCRPASLSTLAAAGHATKDIAQPCDQTVQPRREFRRRPSWADRLQTRRDPVERGFEPVGDSIQVVSDACVAVSGIRGLRPW
jgi:hypothetical protein